MTSSSSSSSDNQPPTPLELTKELHTLLHSNFPSRPDVCTLTAKQMLSCSPYHNFHCLLENSSFPGEDLITDILQCRLALLRFQFSLVLLQVSVYLIQREDEEEDMGYENIKEKLARDYFIEFTNLVIPLYIQLLLDGKAGPKEENLILGLLSNLSRTENGQLRLLQQKSEEELDDEELDEDLDDDDEEVGSVGKFVPWLCKKILSFSQDELESENQGDSSTKSSTTSVADEVDTYTRCIQLLVNVTRTEDGRNYILMKEQEPVLKRVLSTISNGPLLRRRGSIAVVRNCLLVRAQHPIIASFYFVEPFLDRLEAKTEPDSETRRDIAECIYALSLDSQVVKVAPHKDRIMQIHESILINVAEKRLLKLAVDMVEGRTEAIKEGDYVRFDEETGGFSRVNAG